MMTLYALFEKLPLTSLLLHLEEEPSFLPRRQTLLLRQTATTPVPLVEQPGLKFVPFTISCYLMVLLAVQISRQLDLPRIPPHIFCFRKETREDASSDLLTDSEPSLKEFAASLFEDGDECADEIHRVLGEYCLKAQVERAENV